MQDPGHVIVRIVLWRLDERSPPIEELRERLRELEPLPEPSAFLIHEAAERLGVLLAGDEDEPTPPQLEELRLLIGREPDLYEELETFA